MAQRVFDRPSSGSWSGITTPETAARGSGAHFFLTDPQGSPLAIIDATGKITERLSFTAYGVPIHSWPADIDDDGLVDGDDKTTFYTWFFTATSASKSIGGSNYNVDYDIALLGTFAPAMLTAYDAAYTPLPPAVIEGELTVLYDHGGKTRSLSDNIFGWCGYVYNQVTQQYTVRYRDFDPALGRWLQQDPAGFADSMNLYGYSWGNPIGIIDPYGLDAPSVNGEQWHHMTPGDKDTKELLEKRGINRNNKELGRVMPLDKHNGFNANHREWNPDAKRIINRLEAEGRLTKENLAKELDELAKSDKHAKWYQGSRPADVDHDKWGSKGAPKTAGGECDGKGGRKAAKEAVEEGAEKGVKKVAKKAVGPALILWAIAAGVFSDKTIAETVADAVLEGTTGLSLEETKEGLDNLTTISEENTRKARREQIETERNRIRPQGHPDNQHGAQPDPKWDL